MYAATYDFELFPVSFVINPTRSYLGCSPDRRVYDSSRNEMGLLEVKCTMKESVSEVAYLRVVGEGFQLQRSHLWVWTVHGTDGADRCHVVWFIYIWFPLWANTIWLCCLCTHVGKARYILFVGHFLAALAEKNSCIYSTHAITVSCHLFTLSNRITCFTYLILHLTFLRLWFIEQCPNAERQ